LKALDESVDSTKQSIVDVSVVSSQISGASFTGATEKSTSTDVACVFSVPSSSTSRVIVQTPPYSQLPFSITVN
jgi:hypothetical protein